MRDRILIYRKAVVQVTRHQKRSLNTTVLTELSDDRQHSH